MRFLNTAGPCKLDIHYMLPPTEWLPGIRRLIDQQSCPLWAAPERQDDGYARVRQGTDRVRTLCRGCGLDAGG